MRQSVLTPRNRDGERGAMRHATKQRIARLAFDVEHAMTSRALKQRVAPLALDVMRGEAER
ncbi:MAG: hypothetical protein RMA76_44425 [Deltaproteobacteria bacterium]